MPARSLNSSRRTPPEPRSEEPALPLKALRDQRPVGVDTWGYLGIPGDGGGGSRAGSTSSLWQEYRWRSRGDEGCRSRNAPATRPRGVAHIPSGAGTWNVLRPQSLSPGATLGATLGDGGGGSRAGSTSSLWQEHRWRSRGDEGCRSRDAPATRPRGVAHIPSGAGTWDVLRPQGAGSTVPRMDASIVFSYIAGTGSFNEFMATYIW